MPEKDQTICPHCGTKMLRVQFPVEANWGEEEQFVCFYDDCPYFIRGWEHTKKTMSKPASYRNHLNLRTGKYSPLPVWSRDAIRELIIPEDQDKQGDRGEDDE